MYSEEEIGQWFKRSIGDIEVVLPMYWINFLPKEFDQIIINYTYFSLEDAFPQELKFFKLYYRKNLLLSYDGNKIIDLDFNRSRSPLKYLFSVVTNILVSAGVVVFGLAIEAEIYEPINNYFTQIKPVIYTDLIFPVLFVLSSVILAINLILFIIYRYWRFKFALEVGTLNTNFYNFLNPFVGWY
jgi:hypothetical protein